MITLDGLRLPDALQWADEFSWTGSEVVHTLTSGGRLVVYAKRALGENGRPITLEDVEESAWITRDDVNTLHAWAMDPERQMTLLLHDGSVRTVLFRLPDQPVIEAPMRWFAINPGGSWVHILKIIKFVVVK